MNTLITRNKLTAICLFFILFSFAVVMPAYAEEETLPVVIEEEIGSEEETLPVVVEEESSVEDDGVPIGMYDNRDNSILQPRSQVGDYEVDKFK